MFNSTDEDMEVNINAVPGQVTTTGFTEVPRGEPRPLACWGARRVTAMTAYEALDSLIAELDQLQADNRRLNLELAAALSQRDSCSSASPLAGVTGRPELWWGRPD
jgi:hypothetical protein